MNPQRNKLGDLIMDEKVAEFEKALKEHENVIVYCDADEFPNSAFLTNRGIMAECEKQLGEDYKVIYVWGHMAEYSNMCYLVYGVYDNMSPYIVLYKNGVEITRSDGTFLTYYDAPKRLANWIKEQLNQRREIMLSSKERAALRAEANQLTAIFHLGKAAITPDFTEGIREALEARELIKIDILQNCEMGPQEAARILSERTGSEVVQIIGRKIVLYKKAKKPKNKKEEKAQ